MPKLRSVEADASALVHTISRSTCIAKKDVCQTRPSRHPYQPECGMCEPPKTQFSKPEGDFGARSSFRSGSWSHARIHKYQEPSWLHPCTPDESEEADQVFQLLRIDVFPFEDPFQQQRLLVQCSRPRVCVGGEPTQASKPC